MGMETLLHMAQQVCSAMVYLHSLGIVHRYVYGMYFFTMSVVMRDFLLGGTTCMSQGLQPTELCDRDRKHKCTFPMSRNLGIAGTRVLACLPDLENFW